MQRKRGFTLIELSSWRSSRSTSLLPALNSARQAREPKTEPNQPNPQGLVCMGFGPEGSSSHPWLVYRQQINGQFIQGRG